MCQLLNHTPLSPLDITLSSYDHQIKTVRDVEQLFDFNTSGGNSQLTRKQADAIAEGFRQAFFRYLNGVGHVPGLVPHYISAEEHNFHAADGLFRARITLQQLTDSWLLPIGNKRIKVQYRFLCILDGF